jgi:hypothetical protein
MENELGRFAPSRAQNLDLTSHPGRAMNAMGEERATHAALTKEG